jgi:hypothetical protein
MYKSLKLIHTYMHAHTDIPLFKRIFSGVIFKSILIIFSPITNFTSVVKIYCWPYSMNKNWLHTEHGHLINTVQKQRNLSNNIRDGMLAITDLYWAFVEN